MALAHTHHAQTSLLNNEHNETIQPSSAIDDNNDNNIQLENSDTNINFDTNFEEEPSPDEKEESPESMPDWFYTFFER